MTCSKNEIQLTPTTPIVSSKTQLIQRQEPHIHHGADGSPFLILREGENVSDLSKYLVAPIRKHGQFRFADWASLVRYCEKWAGMSDDATAFLSVDESSGCPKKLVIRLNEGTVAELGWCDHTAELEFNLTEDACKVQIMADCVLRLCEFQKCVNGMEDRIIDPELGVLQTTLNSLRGSKRVSFYSEKTHISQSRGYEEDSQVDSRESLVVPDEIIFAVKLFPSSKPVQIKMGLTFSVEGSNINVTTRLKNWTKAMELEADQIKRDCLMGLELEPFIMAQNQNRY